MQATTGLSQTGQNPANASQSWIFKKKKKKTTDLQDHTTPYPQTTQAPSAPFSILTRNYRRSYQSSQGRDL